MDLVRYAEEFWENGYLVIENFFEHDLMDHLNQVILDYFGTTPKYWHNDEFLTKGKTEVVPWFPQNEGVKDFDAIDDNSDLQDLTGKILGDGWNSQYCMVMFSKQGTKGQAWHQDCPPEDSEKFNMNRLVYTMDITPEIGGQAVVIPGTHRKGLLPVGNPEADMEGQIVLEPKKGMLIMLHGHTWHRVLPVTGAYRFSTNYRSAPKGTPDDITDVCVYRNMRYRFSTSELIEERTPA
ncbi:phytanoyl-CoA dioxygenase family protein [bacterium]|nr:phytanoyl-CoA dioxygenase family protein [bacterium]